MPVSLPSMILWHACQANKASHKVMRLRITHRGRQRHIKAGNSHCSGNSPEEGVGDNVQSGFRCVAACHINTAARASGLSEAQQKKGKGHRAILTEVLHIDCMHMPAGYKLLRFACSFSRSLHSCSALLQIQWLFQVASPPSSSLISQQCLGSVSDKRWGSRPVHMPVKFTCQALCILAKCRMKPVRSLISSLMYMPTFAIVIIQAQ